MAFPATQFNGPDSMAPLRRPLSLRNLQLSQLASAAGAPTPQLASPAPLSAQSSMSSFASGLLPKQRPLTCTGHTRPVVDVCFSAVTGSGDHYFLSACKDSNAILRNGITGTTIGTLSGHKGAVWSSRLTPDASTSVTGSADFSAKVWDNRLGVDTRTVPHSHVVRCVDVADDAQVLMTGGYEKIVRLFDLRSADDRPVRQLDECRMEIKHAVLDSTRGLVFNGDGKELRIWDLRTSEALPSRQFEHAITSMRMTMDRKSLICTAGKGVHVFSLDSSELELSVYTNVELSSASIHPARDRVVVGSGSDLWVRTYDVQTGNELEICKGHHGPIHAVSHSPDGLVYASGSEDGTVRLWQTFPGLPHGPWAG
ncbi:WD40-repeat-containing domain protein [Entophlyctis helioformis]|nr:WD40-repeat-containing domain protein [Entophlyctis helioformis]